MISKGEGLIDDFVCTRDYKNNNALTRIKSKKELYKGLLLWISFDDVFGAGPKG